MNPLARRRAFTLVEILICIAIVAFLISLAVPALMRARAASRTTLCTSNLKQLYAAVALYAQDNDGLLPPYQNSKGARVGVEGEWSAPVPDQASLLIAALAPYAKKRDIWFCPEDPDQGRATVADALYHQFTSYKVHPQLGDARILGRVVHIDGPTGPLQRFSTAELGLMTDSVKTYSPQPGAVGQNYSHNGKFNVLYFDGHVTQSLWDNVPF